MSHALQVACRCAATAKNCAWRLGHGKKTLPKRQASRWKSCITVVYRGIIIWQFCGPNLQEEAVGEPKHLHMVAMAPKIAEPRSTNVLLPGFHGASRTPNHGTTPCNLAAKFQRTVGVEDHKTPWSGLTEINRCAEMNRSRNILSNASKMRNVIFNIDKFTYTNLDKILDNHL